MDPILEELTEIAAQARAHGLSVVVVGALAVRAWLRDPEQRLTRDLEIQIRRGVLTFLAAASSGSLARLWEERHGAPLPAGAVAEASRRLQELVG